MPFFSITIPVYNVEKYIRQCLDSVLGQTFGDFEVIILDDGSTDQSGSICDEYAKKDARIKVLHDENQGSFMARLRALKYVNGEYILFLDSDDYWEDNLLESVYKVVFDKQVDMVLLRYRAVAENGKELYCQRKLLDEQEIVEDAQRFLCYQLATSFEYNSMAMKVIKREAIDMHSDYSFVRDVAMGDDAIQTAKIMHNISSFIYLSKPFYNYRVNISSLTTRVTKKYASDYLKVRTVMEEETSNYFGIESMEYIHKMEYDIRGFVGLLADSANSVYIDNQEWKDIRKYVIKSELFQNAYRTRYRFKFISKIYLAFIIYGYGWTWKLLGKLKIFLRFLYNRKI